MEINVIYDGELIKKSMESSSISMDDLLEQFKHLLQIEDSVDVEVSVRGDDGQFTPLSPSCQVFDGATFAVKSGSDDHQQKAEAEAEVEVEAQGKTENDNDEDSKQTEHETVEKETSHRKNDRFVVRLRGLPWSAREPEIKGFFSDEEVKEIQIVYLTDGRASGEALVEFGDLTSFSSAFSKNRQHIGHRYIELFKSTAQEIDTAAGRCQRAPAVPPKSQYVIRMRGLPYSATDEDVFDFFDLPRPTTIHLIKDDLGRPSGEGFVEFKCELDAIAAMAKHRHHMAHRYIELFRSSPEELMRALGLTTGSRCYNITNGGCGSLSGAHNHSHSHSQPQPKSTCILMRGLPYSCTESDITKFFQEIDVTPIRIHRKADGAEAYVEFYNISDTDNAMTRHRNYIGRRYIELFRVTYQDMARTVGLPVANTNIPASHIINFNKQQKQQQQSQQQQQQQLNALMYYPHHLHFYHQQQQQQQQQPHHYQYQYQHPNPNQNQTAYYQ